MGRKIMRKSKMLIAVFVLLSVFIINVSAGFAQTAINPSVQEQKQRDLKQKIADMLIRIKENRSKARLKSAEIKEKITRSRQHIKDVQAKIEDKKRQMELMKSNQERMVETQKQKIDNLKNTMEAAKRRTAVRSIVPPRRSY